MLVDRILQIVKAIRFYLSHYGSPYLDWIHYSNCIELIFQIGIFQEKNVLTQEIIFVSKYVNEIMEKAYAIKLEYQRYPKEIKLLYNALQNLINMHNRFPEIFSTNKDVIASTRAFIEASKDLIAHKDNSKIIDLESLKLNIENAQINVSELGKHSEFFFFEKNIQRKLNLAKLDMEESIKIRSQIQSYIEYQARALKSIIKS